MAKLKADWLNEAKALGLDVTEKNKVGEIKEAVEAALAEEPKEKFAKAGKRSAKAAKEAEELEAKEERKAKVAKGELNPSEEAPTRGPVPVPRPMSERRSKSYKEVFKKIESEKIYSLEEAVKLALQTSTTKFDASVEMHIRLNVDPRQADQNIRETIILPNGTGKELTVAVFAPKEQHEAAKKAGADIVGEEDFLEQLKKEELNFDVLVSMPEVMSQLGRYAKVLGPKGLMPNPKSGTVTKDVAKAVSEAKAGRVELRVDPQGIIHIAIGKVSFGDEKITQNATVVEEAIKVARPSSIKGDYIASKTITTSMGPGIKYN